MKNASYARVSSYYFHNIAVGLSVVDTYGNIKLFGKEIKLHIRANGVETLADDGRRLDITEF